MEELSSQFAHSYNRVWGFRLGGKWVESVFGIKSERDVLSLAFHFFHLPNLSTRSLVCICVFLFNSNNATIFLHFFVSFFVFGSILFILSIASVNYLLVKVSLNHVCYAVIVSSLMYVCLAQFSCFLCHACSDYLLLILIIQHYGNVSCTFDFAEF